MAAARQAMNQSTITPYQAKYFAYELLKRANSETSEKFGVTLLDAQVELNPHQVEAALFAFKSPYSKGAILADEVGLGKTIEAGIVLSQQWAENKRRILIICPSSLRKQWVNELADKFYLKAEVLESKSFRINYHAGNKNPFDDAKTIKICSYQFASKQAELIQLTSWDLVVPDEAHYLRNVHKVVEGVTRTGIKTLVIWRDMETTTHDDVVKLIRRFYDSTRTREFQQIYINGDHHLENLRTHGDQFKIKGIVETFSKKCSMRVSCNSIIRPNRFQKPVRSSG